MLDYSVFHNKDPEIVMNSNGLLFYDNRVNINLRLEIDYNLFSEEELKKIILERDKDFEEVTRVATYTDEGKVDGILIKTKDGYQKIKTENSTHGFKFIKFDVAFMRGETKVLELKSVTAKRINDITLPDGDYHIDFIFYNDNNEEISKNSIPLILKTNEFSMGDGTKNSNTIIFNEYEGNFDLKISSLGDKYYSFQVDDIVSKSEDIFFFYFWNKYDDSIKRDGVVGAKFHLSNQTIIEESEDDTLDIEISGTFVYKIRELFTTNPTEGSIGLIRIPTIKEKTLDNMKRYFDLKVDVNQAHESIQEIASNLLITDKFNGDPLFFKFIVVDKFKEFSLYDNDNKEILDYFIDKKSETLSIVYFNPLRGKNYSYKVDDSPYINIKYKKSYEGFRMVMSDSKNYKSEEPLYVDNLIIRSEDDNAKADVTITFSDDSTRLIKDFPLKKPVTNIFGHNKYNDKNTNYTLIPDERIKLDREIKSVDVVSEKEFAYKIDNFLCDTKEYSVQELIYFKKDYRDFVYIAKEQYAYNEIPLDGYLHLTLDKRYAVVDDQIIESPTGPLKLIELSSSDIVFSDIDEYCMENSIINSSSVKVESVDDFYIKNVKRGGATIWKG